MAIVQNTTRKAVVRRGKLPTLEDLSRFYARVVQFEESGPHHDTHEEHRYKGNLKHRDSAPIIGDTPLETPLETQAEDSNRDSDPQSQAGQEFSRGLELSDDSRGEATACENAMTQGEAQEPLANSDKETNHPGAADTEDADADNVSGAELCDEAPRLCLVQQSQNDNDDEMAIESTQGGEGMEEHWNPEDMTEDQVDTQKASPRSEKRPRIDPEHPPGFCFGDEEEEEEEEMRKIARQNASESRGLDHQIKGKSMLISMAERVARVGKSTVGSLMMKVTSGIPWSGQKSKDSDEASPTEEEDQSDLLGMEARKSSEMLQMLSPKQEQSQRQSHQSSPVRRLKLDAFENSEDKQERQYHSEKGAARLEEDETAAAASACEEEMDQSRGDYREKVFSSRAVNKAKGARRAVSGSQAVQNIASEPAALNVKQLPATRARESQTVEKSVNSKQKSRIRTFAEREKTDRGLNRTYAAYSTPSRAQSNIETSTGILHSTGKITICRGGHLGGFYEELGQSRVNLERKRRALIQNLD